MHYLEDLSYDEIARLLDIPPGTVMSRLGRARQSLKELVHDQTRGGVPAGTIEDMKGEVLVEIDVLNELFSDNPEAAQRLSVLVENAPDRVGRLIAVCGNPEVLVNLGQLLPRLGKPAIRMALDCWHSDDPRGRANALTVLVQAAVSCGRHRQFYQGRTADGQFYVLLDMVLSHDGPAANTVKQRLAQLTGSDDSTVRNHAIETLGTFRALQHAETVRSCASHSDGSTRVAALRALAEMRDTDSVSLLVERSLHGQSVERVAAISGLSAMGAAQALESFIVLADDDDPAVQDAAVTGIGETGEQPALAVLGRLLAAGTLRRKKTIVKAMSRLNGRLKESIPQPRNLREELMWRKLRGDSIRIVSHISIETVLRTAITEMRTYDEKELTRLIGKVVWDVSTVRRQLVEQGFMFRQDGVYEFTPMGAAAWRVERFVQQHYIGV